MLGATVEVIAQATTSTHFIFCFCNIIIVFLLIDRSKRNLNPSITNHYPFPIALDHSNVTQINYVSYAEATKEETSVKSTAGVAAKIEATEENDHECEGDTQEKGNEEKKEEYNEEEEDDNDELRKRVEEFISKINREWRAERMRTGY